MPGSNEFQIIRPANLLKAKVGGHLGRDSVAIERAQAELSGLQESYTDWIRNDLQTLADTLDAVGADPNAAAPHLKTMQRLTHDIKGQAGTFGYPLITLIAGSANDMLRRTDRVEEREIELLSAHINAMNIVVREKIQGDGGASGRELIRRLQAATRQLSD